MIKAIIMKMIYGFISVTAGCTTAILGISALHYFVSLSSDLEIYIIYWFFFGILILSFVSYVVTNQVLREDWAN